MNIIDNNLLQKEDLKTDENTEITPSYVIIDNINNIFKVPIYYNKDKIELKKHIITDLELIHNIDTDTSSNSIYSYYFNNNNIISSKITEQISQYYTTDITFLEDNQKLIKEYIPLPLTNKYTNISTNYNTIIDIWNELKIESGFKEKYCYINWDKLEFLNNSEWFLQIMSIYNLFSPLFSLIVPIIILIIPFFIIKLKGLSITINDYIKILKVVANQNAIGKLFTSNFNEINFQDKIYIFISAAFYIFSIYQNIMICFRFNNNMKLIHSHFSDIKIYLETTINSMKNYRKFSESLTSHALCNNTIDTNIEILNTINQKLLTISEYNICKFSKLKEIGHILKYFYELHSNPIYNDSIIYSIGFNGYIDCIEGLQLNIQERKINFAYFIKNKSTKLTSNKNVFENSYYACLKDTKHVKNTIKFKKNQIISGPNASGKTTILKSTILNIIFTQQFGCGFYDSSQFTPFKFIHCYINIPDTSGRDSLFQAEARRCKEILDIISANKDDLHFCVFDELYSGTNPEEAEYSAISFMKYLQKFTNVNCLLTTHFIKVCKKLNKIKTIQNCKMITTKIDNTLKYTYKLKSGISQIKGGINILKQLDYPIEIINNSNS